MLGNTNKLRKLKPSKKQFRKVFLGLNKYMTIEIISGVEEKLRYCKIHEARRHIKRQVDTMDPSLWASARASILLLTGSPAEVCLESKSHLTKNFGKYNWEKRVQLIQQTNDLCNRIGTANRKNLEENSFAYQAKALTVLSKIVKAGIAEGEEAVMVTSMLMGSSQIAFGEAGLTVGWKNKVSI